MTLPPTNFSGTNSNRLEPQLQYIYDSSISAYRAINQNDLAPSIVTNITGTVNVSGTDLVRITGVDNLVFFPVNSTNTVGVTGGVAITGNPTITFANTGIGVSGGNINITNYPSGFFIKGSGGYFGDGIISTVAVSEQGELFTTNVEQAENVFSRYTLNNVTNSGWAILVDKSDTGNYPHRYTGRLDVSYSSIQVDKDANMGVVTFINGSYGNVKVFNSLLFDRSSASTLIKEESYQPSQIKLAVIGSGQTPYMVGPLLTGETGINSSFAIPSALGVNTIPGSGDLLIRVESIVGGFNFSAKVLYHSEQSPSQPE